MRNGKYKAFYVSNEQHDEINAMLKQCQEITLEQINELYPSTRKIIINITEKDIMILALKKYLKQLQSS
jgi:allophanate hydrolase subunit 1